jgi:thymidylate kinase
VYVLAKKFIVFVGPQGCGKSTQARLLNDSLTRNGASVNVVSFLYYVSFHNLLARFTMKIKRQQVTEATYYENLPPQAVINPTAYRDSYLLSILLHITSLLLTLSKLRMVGSHSNIVIDHEGYLFKEIVDFNYSAHTIKISSHRFLGKLLRFLNVLFLSILKKTDAFVIFFGGSAESLRERYLMRQSGIEPIEYLNFQIDTYRQIVSSIEASKKVKLLRVDQTSNIDNIHNAIVDFVK